MTASKATLCIFVRAPNLGQVKSRLAASVGEPAALAAHIELVDHLLARLEGTQSRLLGRVDTQLWLADAPVTASASQQLQRWQVRSGSALQHQQGSGLGERMDHALASCVANGRYGLLVGSDCPTIDWAYLDAAVIALDAGADLVLGPAEDGGYGLIGLAQPQPTLFQEIAWGTDQVLAQTLAKAQQAALRVELLGSVWDVDDLADWQRFQRSFPDTG